MNDNNMTRITVTLEDMPEDSFDWTHFDALTDEEVELAARSDPEAQPISSAQLRRFRDPMGFTQTEQGKFYRPATDLETPIYLEKDLVRFFTEIAQRKNIGLQEFIDLILRKEMDLLRFATT